MIKESILLKLNDHTKAKIPVWSLTNKYSQGKILNSSLKTQTYAIFQVNSNADGRPLYRCTLLQSTLVRTGMTSLIAHKTWLMTSLMTRKQ